MGTCAPCVTARIICAEVLKLRDIARRILDRALKAHEGAQHCIGGHICIRAIRTCRLPDIARRNG